MNVAAGFIILIVFLWVFFRNPRDFKDPSEVVATEYEIEGVKLRCQHCSYSSFFQGRAQLNTAIATLLGLDWANKEASYLSCKRCGHLHWFKRDFNQVKKWRLNSPEHNESQELPS